MDFFTGQIMPMATNYAPKQTASCNGQIMPINQNQALFALLGITYGGNGQSTYALPDLQGKIPFGVTTTSNNGQPTYPLGATGGETAHALTNSEMPLHSHSLLGSSQAGTSVQPAGVLSATSAPAYGAAQNLVQLGGSPLPSAGGGAPHNNLQPTTVLNYCIVLFGIFPSRS